MDSFVVLGLVLAAALLAIGILLFFSIKRRKQVERFTASHLFEGEFRDLRAEAGTLFADPDAWLETPNSVFGGRTPAKVIKDGEEQKVRDFLRALKHGMFS